MRLPGDLAVLRALSRPTHRSTRRLGWLAALALLLPALLVLLAGGPPGWMNEQAAWGLVPLAGPFIAAARVPAGGLASLVVVDVLCGVYEVIGFGLLAGGFAMGDRVPPPLRRGATYASRWMLAPVAASGPGATFAFTW